MLKQLSEAVINGQINQARELTEKLLAAGEAVEVILNSALIPAMEVVGDKYQKGEYFVPEMLLSARAMYAGLNLLKPLLTGNRTATAGTVVLGTVKGDLHDIGKNLVGMMLEGAGFQVIDLGTNVNPDKFISAVKDNGAQVVGMSALITTTMREMQPTIEKFKEAGLRDKVKIIVGGAPVTEEYARKIGADGYAADAAGAVEVVKRLVS